MKQVLKYLKSPVFDLFSQISAVTLFLYSAVLCLDLIRGAKYVDFYTSII